MTEIENSRGAAEREAQERQRRQREEAAEAHTRHASVGLTPFSGMRTTAGSFQLRGWPTAFPPRAIMDRYLVKISWETEVWVADTPSHLIHFNGMHFLGPYQAP